MNKQKTKNKDTNQLINSFILHFLCNLLIKLKMKDMYPRRCRYIHSHTHTDTNVHCVTEKYIQNKSAIIYLKLQISPSLQELYQLEMI